MAITPGMVKINCNASIRSGGWTGNVVIFGDHNGELLD